MTCFAEHGFQYMNVQMISTYTLRYSTLQRAQRAVENEKKKKLVTVCSDNDNQPKIQTPPPYTHPLRIIRDPRAHPRIRIIVLIKVPHRPSASEARNRRVRPTERDVVFVVEKVGRVPRKVRRREETRVVVQKGRGPFPDAAVGAFAATFVETCRSPVVV